MATIGHPVGRGDWHLVRGTDMDLAVRWETDLRDGTGYQPVDLSGWEATLKLYETYGELLYELTCETDSYGYATAHVPADAFGGAEWDAVTSGSWRMTATDGEVTVPLGEGYFSLGYDAGPHQVCDRRTVGIPDDLVAAREDVRQMRDATAETLAATLLVERRVTDTCASYTSAALGYAQDARASADEAAESAERAETAASASRAVIVGPDEPPADELWDGRAWLQVVDGAVKSVNVWDTTVADGVLRCGACTCGPDTVIKGFGAWVKYPLAATA